MSTNTEKSNFGKMLLILVVVLALLLHVIGIKAILSALKFFQTNPIVTILMLVGIAFLLLLGHLVVNHLSGGSGGNNPVHNLLNHGGNQN